MRTSDVFISHPQFGRYVTKPKSLSPIGLKISSLNNKGIISGLKWQIQLQPRFTLQPRLTIHACSTAEGHSVISDSSSDLKFDSKLEFGKDESDESSDLDEKERMRRLRIGKANSGRIPWNKGRKHSPETRQKIIERTKIAMQNPKVRMKLMNHGRAQTEETKAKIAQTVREIWKKKSEKLSTQEYVISYSNTDLKFDSKLKFEKERSESTRVDKRVLKSNEHKMRLSESIRAKWADPDYRKRVLNGLMSEERKAKTTQASREYWKRRREKRMVQERCIFEWQNSIAELARLGFSGQDELQWNSYEDERERMRKNESDESSNLDEREKMRKNESDESSDLDERERVRRLRISEANKGNIPWNKGKKHNPETLEKIRERTRIAMQSPEVKLKRMNIPGHDQSDETKAKIAQKMKEVWNKKREKVMLEEEEFVNEEKSKSVRNMLNSVFNNQ